MKHLNWLFTGLLCIAIHIVYAQKRMYDVVFLGDTVGTTSVEKKILPDNLVSYHFDSKANATVFFIKTNTHAKTDIIFDKTKLIKGYVLRKKNEEKQELTYQWNGKAYDIVDNGKKLSISKPITFCTANFFLIEPLLHKEVFVERFNYFVPIQHLGNHQYQTHVDGGTNLYTYKNGVLQSLKSTKGVSVYMYLRK